jgi:hypothetical protein
MVIQQIDGSFIDSSNPIHANSARQVFYTEIPHESLAGLDGWIDRLIGYAFETLDTQHFELYVVDPDE